MSESKAEYKVVIDQEASDNGQHQQQTIVAPSGFKLSPGMRAVLPIASYCFASILMTVTNKYVLSGYDFNMNFLLLTIQVSFSSSFSFLPNTKMYIYRTWLQLYYYNPSSFLISSSFVDSIKRKHVNGYLLLAHLLPWSIQVLKHFSSFVFPFTPSLRTWLLSLLPMEKCSGLVAVWHV